MQLSQTLVRSFGFDLSKTRHYLGISSLNFTHFGDALLPLLESLERVKFLTTFRAGLFNALR